MILVVNLHSEPSHATALLACAGAALAQQKRIAIANFGEAPALTAAIGGFKKALAKLATGLFVLTMLALPCLRRK